MPRRILGRTGERISIIGLGGIVVMNESPQTAREIVRSAVEQGVNYFDVAPSYDDAEEVLGPALKPYREQVFLSCKTLERSRRKAEEELDKSLQRLQTDYIDLYQFHGFSETRDVNRSLSRGGALDAFLKAKEEGKIRYIGFSAHSSEAALRAMEKFDFDTILFPVNYACFYKDFGPAVIQMAKEKKIGILGIKALARQPWPSEDQKKHWPKCWYQPILDPEEAYLALRFSLTQPVTAVIPPGDLRLFRSALEMAHGYTPLTEAEDRRLRLLAESLDPLFPIQP
ncbi:MAG: aldo/keto reductase [Candidatus Aminicenantes bacterium]|nr:aldo/keto reductase [Candidatus Aminicenantes bacterium]